MNRVRSFFRLTAIRDSFRRRQGFYATRRRRDQARRRWAGLLTLVSAAAVLVVTLPGPAQAASSFPLRVDFGTAAMTPVSGYVLDYGQPYGARTGSNQGTGNTYGWVSDGTSTPLDLTGDGRVRTGTGVSDTKATTLMHMQRTAATPGAWEAEVPNGNYTVTVGVGDASAVYDSTHAISVEGQQTIDPYVPTASTKLKEGSITVAVDDGRLTVRPDNGINTKITYLSIEVATEPVGPTLPIKVDFGAQSSVPATGSVLDYGRSYRRQGDNTYGWVKDGTTTPLDLTKNGRQRTGTTGVTDDRLKNFIAMQYTGSTSSGNPTPGAWEIAVRNGTYRVTVAVGDANYVYDSEHAAKVEAEQAILPYVPTATTRFKITTVDVPVTDGRLTIRATGGTNTKIDYLEIDDWTQPATPTFPLKVDFGASTSPVATGYTLDYGQPFGPRNGGYSYGWVVNGSSTPLDLTKNGRQRTDSTVSTTDARFKSLMHMQFPAGSSNGTSTPGAWELAVPNATYKVTVGVGDASALFDSKHAIALEDLQLIQPYQPTTSNRFKTATTIISVTDGRLTISPTGGTNTKIDYVDIEAVDTNRPRLLTVTPTDGDSGVTRDSSVTAEVYLPQGAINPNTVTSSTVRLFDVATGAQIPSAANTSGGGDVLVLTPTDTLAADTQFRFEITDGVQDIAGNAFLPHVSTFTTGQVKSGNGIPGVGFDKIDNPATAGNLFTSTTIGPDHKLYAGSINGYVFRYTIEADGTLSNQEKLTTVRDHNPDANGFPTNRTIVGLTFDPASTADNLILWVTDNYTYVGTDDVPNWSSKLDKLTGPNLENFQNVLVNLPRSAHDHEANSIAFGPDGKLYFTMGSNTGMGYPDVAWANRPESLLSGAVLRVDPDKLPADLPLDVKPADGGGSYDPYAPDAPVTLYATGVRNAFDLVWHSNGQLYAPTNGSASGSNIPGIPSALPAECSTTRPDLAQNGPWTYSGPTVNTILGNPNAQTDYIHKITKGGYYGHPNPTRCEYVSYGGNPTDTKDPWQEGQYPVGVQPDRNFRSDDVYDAGLHASADGAIEYHGNAFGGALDGKLLVVRYSAGKDIMVFDPSGPNGKILSSTLGVTGFTGFDDPLDLTEDVANGYIYVTELGGAKITLLKPQV
jgi:glucose/arabinose dehydrogenase